MSDYVIKLIPYEPFEVDYMKAWLNDLAAQGLILEKVTFIFAKFKKTNFFHTRFQIDFSPETDSETDCIKFAFWEDHGWQYVTNFSDRYVIYKTEDPSVMELPLKRTTPSVYGFLQIFTFSLLAFFGLLYLAFTFYYEANQKGGVLIALLGNFSSDGSIIVFISLLILGTLPIIRLIQLKRREKSAELQNENDSMFHSIKMRILAKSIPMLAILFVVGFFIFGLQHSNLIPPENYTKSTHIPLLEEINPEEGRALSEEMKSDDLELVSQLRNSIRKNHRILAPEIIRINQRGPTIEINETTSRNLYTYTVDCYEMLSRQLAERYARELSASLTPNQTISASEGVYALYSGTGDGQSLLIQYHNIVIKVSYHGATDLRDCIPLYEAYLGINQES